MRVRALIVPMLFLVAAPAQAQEEGGGLQSAILDLFRFANCPDPLCLTVADPNRQRDFVTASAQGNRPLIEFLGNSIGRSVASVPLSSASSGVIFTFEGGVPSRQDISTGPIFAERAQTLGAGRFLVGANVTAMGFSSIRGVPLDNVSFTFTHQNVGAAALGDPDFENDVIQVDLDLDVNLVVGQIFAVYGLHDRVDLGITIPLVQTSLGGTSVGRIIPFGASSPHHFGTATAPTYVATASIDESAAGIGDVAGRLKVNLSRAQVGALAFLADVRLPTGDRENLLGSGSLGVRGLGVLSARWGDFSPHLNAGYQFWAEEDLTNAILATVGFDQLVRPWATFAFDLISQWQAAEGTLEIPGTVQYTEPFVRTVEPTNIPDRRDDLLDASFGFRVNHASGLRGLINALVPMNDGGLRSNVVVTIGVEYNGAGPSLFGGS
ncbi:MAG TPA: hypothetical protein VMM12_05835, partial [Longimicrobiales bacterium]|nr:hypothetical protein [Longimicrobiales bacterium]